MIIIIVISACFAYFGSVIGMYLILKKIDKDTNTDSLRFFSVCWPLWAWLVPIMVIAHVCEMIFDKIDEDANTVDKWIK